MKARTLAQIYDAVPRIACTGACWQSCGPIPMSPAEVLAVRAAALVPFEMVPSGELGHPVMTIDDLRCPQLDAMRRCSVYAARPLICRLYGVAAGMRCEHGCEPEHELSDEEARDLLAAALEARR